MEIRYSILRIESKTLAGFDKTKKEAEEIAQKWNNLGIRCEVIPNSKIPNGAMG